MGESTESRPRVIGPQPGKQARLLSCPCDEIGYGGAVGGGKTFGILLDYLAQHLRHPGNAKGIVFRKTYPELEDLVEQSQEIFPLFGGLWNIAKYTWTLPGGSWLRMRYIDKPNDHTKYQGHQYTWMAFDEAGNWADPAPLDKLKARLRSKHAVKSRIIYTANPGGPGHNWFKKRFIDPVPFEQVQHLEDGRTRTFIFAKLTDNRILMKNDPGYIGRIRSSGPKWLVSAWLDGNWDIVAGGAIDDRWDRQKQVIPPFEIPSRWRVDRGLDWGSAKPFSVLWFAESNGEEVEIRGKTRFFPKGSIIVFDEWYGSIDDEENAEKGLGLTSGEVSKGVKERDSDKPMKVLAGPADNSIFAVVDGDSIAKKMEKAPYRVKWARSNKGPGSRVAGLDRIREMLGESIKDRPEGPGLWITENCRRLIQHLPALTRDKKNLEDIDTDQPDHDYDVLRYRVMATRKKAGSQKLDWDRD